MEVKKYKLGEIATIIPGYAFKSADFGYGENIVIKIKDIIPPSINILEADKVGYTPDDKFRLEVGDYVMAMTGATIGKIGRMNIRKTNVFINQRVCKFIPNEHLCNKDYLYYLLNNECFTRFVTNNIDSKLAQPNIGHPTLYKFEHLFPPIIKQKQIASVLSNIDSKIELNRAINQNLEAMAKQLYDYWFVQFDFPDENGRPYKSSGGKMVWNEKLKREIPKGWNNCTLQEFLTIKNGRDHKHLATGSYPVYGSGGEMRRVNEYLFSGESVLMPRKGTLNNIMYVNESFWTVDTMFYSEMKIMHSAKYVFFAIKDIDFTKWNSGTGLPSMTASTLYNISMIKPSDDLLKRFNDVLIPVFYKIKQTKDECEKLIKQRDELLPLLMNGQVSVNSDLSDD